MSDNTTSQETVPVVSPPQGPAHPWRAPLIVAIVVVLAAGGSILGYELSSSSASPSSSPPTSAATPFPTPAQAPQVPLVPGGVSPPSSINDTCSQDVTLPLMTWLYTLPNAKPTRTVVNFGKGCYEVNGELWLRAFQNWVFEGGTIRQVEAEPRPVPTSMMPRAPAYCGLKKFTNPANTPYSSAALTFFMEGGCDISFLDMHIIGPNRPGQHNGSKIVDTAISFAGTQRGLVDGLTIENPYGDFVDAQGLHEAPRGGGNFPATDITVENNSFGGAGREGIGVILASRVVVKDNTFYSVDATVFDIEFDADCACGHQTDILFADNKIVGLHYAFLLAALTAAEIDRFRFTGNQLIDGAQMRVEIEPHSKSYNIEIDHNLVTGAADWPHRAAITIKNVQDVLILDNTVPVLPWKAGESVGGPFARVSSGIVSGNRLTLTSAGHPSQSGTLVVVRGGATACANISGSGTPIGSACGSIPTLDAPAGAATPK